MTKKQVLNSIAKKYNDMAAEMTLELDGLDLEYIKDVLDFVAGFVEDEIEEIKKAI